MPNNGFERYAIIEGSVCPDGALPEKGGVA